MVHSETDVEVAMAVHEEPAILDPASLPHDDIVEALRSIQATLWPAGDPDRQWSPDTIDKIVGIMADAGLAPGT